MGYMHILNLYKDQTILKFDEVYALEKLHGTSAHIGFESNKLSFFSGGEKYENFKALFDEDHLRTAFSSFAVGRIKVYGEAIGGKCQGMRETYGNELKFIVFDVRFNGEWLVVPRAADVAKFLNLGFVSYEKITTRLEDIDRARDADSVQAVRNGVGEGKKREGIVLRPLEELVDAKGNRIIVKHKRAEFMETRTPRKVDPEKQLVLKEANVIAEEWVTPMRLKHVMTVVKVMRHMIDKQPLDMTDTGRMISAMTEDVYREAKGEIVEDQAVKKAIGKHTARLFKRALLDALK
ncbi:hypothetical protein LCGC14_1225530 [marine sediment metagenome]|uniref:RNA ligase domain-containing protein n=1 Tax=marine sediment metagenome TaxID=412755 RepID=A0A0F9LA28_9ZZZZ|nr:hypothetical protein [Pricia sp.]